MALINAVGACVVSLRTGSTNAGSLDRRHQSQSVTLEGTLSQLNKARAAVVQLQSTKASLEKEVSELKALNLWLWVLCVSLAVVLLYAIARIALS
jgi:hypothetical protein